MRYLGHLRDLAGRVRSRLYEMGARGLLARFWDLTTVAWVVAFHRIIGRRFLYAMPGFDEHYFVWDGFAVTKGFVPYRDFQEFKPPMIFLVNALGLKLFGLDEMAYRHIFSLLSLCGFLSIAIALLSRQTNRFLVAALLAFMIDHFFDSSLHDSTINNAESAGLDFFMIGCGILLTKTRWERIRNVAGGAFLAMAPMSKEPLAFVTVAGWVSILLLHHFESPHPRTARRFGLFTAAGVSAVALSWLGYMLLTSSLGWYIVQLKLTIAYTKHYAYQLGWFPKTPAEGEAAESWRRLRATYVNAAHIGIYVPLFVAALTLWSGKRKLIGVAAMAAMAAALYAVTIGHGFAAHYYIMAMTGTFFFAVIGAIALDVHSRRSAMAIRRWIGLAWIALAFVVLWPRFSDERDKYDAYKPQVPPVSQSEVAFVRSHSSPEDKIWTLGEPLLYVYSDRLNAIREPGVYDEVIEYYPGNTDEERLAGQREELEKSRPKLVVFGDDPVPGYGRKARYIAALVTPFLRDHGYQKVEEKFYVRP